MNETDTLTEPEQQPGERMAQLPRNRFDRMEWAGAFGDLGTLIPFVTAYVAVLKMDPIGILLGFGLPLVLCGWFYRTPFPVQPMKAIGAVAATGAAPLSMLHGGPVIAAAWLTGAFWLIAGTSGLASRIARWVPREVGQGIVLGLGIGFMLEGMRMMTSDWLAAGAGLLIVLVLRKSRILPGMFALLLFGIVYSLISDAALGAQLRQVSIGLRWPHWQGGNLSWEALLTGALYLALPQLPLTLGNAIIGTKEENNRLFPDRPISIRGISVSTGLLNLFGAAIGGVPMCHGAGGMAAHVSFGARTGGASIILGSVLIGLGLLFSDSVELLLHALPLAVLGVILFMTGGALAMRNLPSFTRQSQSWLPLVTACVALWNVAAAFAVGLMLSRIVQAKKTRSRGAG
jgi:MFS superfamily sulfate permease-like transporter